MFSSIDMAYRLEKFASTLQQALGEILGRESLDSGLRMISVVRVQPARDLKRAAVFITCPAGAEEAILEQLAGAAGFIKKRLGQKMLLRTMPELDFELDTTLDLESKLVRLVPQENFPCGDSPCGIANGKEDEDTNR